MNSVIISASIASFITDTYIKLLYITNYVKNAIYRFLYKLWTRQTNFINLSMQVMKVIWWVNELYQEDVEQVLLDTDHQATGLSENR